MADKFVSADNLAYIWQKIKNLLSEELAKTGHKIDLSLDNSNYVMTINLLDSSNKILSTGSIDLPLETMVVDADYDDANKTIILTLQNGNTTSFSVADLISGLVKISDLDNYLLKADMPVTKLSSMDAENPVVLRNLESNVYILHGYILPYEGSSDLYAAQTPIQASVAKSSDASFVQLFFPYNNMLQYFEITDSSYTEKSLSLNNIVINTRTINNKTLDEDITLNSDDIDDTNQTHKFVTDTEKSNWNDKVDKTSYQVIEGQKVFSKPIRTGQGNNESDFRAGVEIDEGGVITCKNERDGANFITRLILPTIEDTRIDVNVPKKSGTIALTNDIPTDNSQLTNGAGYTKVEPSTTNGNIKVDNQEITVYTLPTDVTKNDQLSFYGSSIEMSIDDSTYVVSLKLINAEGTQLGETQTIDLPLESVVVNGAYDNTTKEVILTLDNGNEIRFSVADLVSGLQSEITSTNKLSSDLVDDTDSANKFVTDNEKETWNNKANVSDIPTKLTQLTNDGDGVDGKKYINKEFLEQYVQEINEAALLGYVSGINYYSEDVFYVTTTPTGESVKTYEYYPLDYDKNIAVRPLIGEKVNLDYDKYKNYSSFNPAIRDLTYSVTFENEDTITIQYTGPSDTTINNGNMAMNIFADNFFTPSYLKKLEDNTSYLIRITSKTLNADNVEQDRKFGLLYLSYGRNKQVGESERTNGAAQNQYVYIQEMKYTNTGSSVGKYLPRRAFNEYVLNVGDKSEFEYSGNADKEPYLILRSLIPMYQDWKYVYKIEINKVDTNCQSISDDEVNSIWNEVTNNG